MKRPWGSDGLPLRSLDLTISKPLSWPRPQMIELCHLDRLFSQLFLTMFSSFCAKFCSPRELKGGTFQLKLEEALNSRVFAGFGPFREKRIYAKCRCAEKEAQRAPRRHPDQPISMGNAKK